MMQRVSVGTQGLLSNSSISSLGAAGFTLFAAFATPAAAELACEGLTGEVFGVDGVRIVASEHLGKGEKSPRAHCLVEGVTAERTGLDGESYAVRFELRLPDEWNGDFFHQLNGGDNGNVRAAFGPLLGGDKSATALGRGYAVLSTDGGHDGSAQSEWGLAGSYRFALDPEAREYFGHKTTETMAPLGKALIAAYYGSAPEYSYAVGCSNGGRHTLMAATRLADEYDGFLAGAPGFNLPKAAVQHAHDVQSFTAVTGDMRTAFSRADLGLVADAIRTSCDALDGASDGMVLDTQACQSAFDIGALTCSAGQNDMCLRPEQVAALATTHIGPIDSEGRQLYSDWSWDTGIGVDSWRVWKLESGSEAMDRLPRIATKGAASLAYLFTTPPTEIEGDTASLVQFLLDFDLDSDAARVAATAEPFTRSAMDVIVPPGTSDPKLTGMQAAGGKLIVFHGVSDPVFSENDTRAWYAALAANNGGTTADFAKYYPVPGMTHCSGGPATDNFDLFTPLVDWVERGIEPQSVSAGLTDGNQEVPENWPAERTRKLCPAPLKPVFVSGNVEAAESFACEP